MEYDPLKERYSWIRCLVLFTIRCTGYTSFLQSGVCWVSGLVHWYSFRRIREPCLALNIISVLFTSQREPCPRYFLPIRTIPKTLIHVTKLRKNTFLHEKCMMFNSFRFTLKLPMKIEI